MAALFSPLCLLPYLHFSRRSGKTFWLSYASRATEQGDIARQRPSHKKGAPGEDAPWGKLFREPMKGLEPATYYLRNNCSTN